MLKAQRRHLPPCTKPMWDAGYTKCGCPIVIRGTLAGKHITISTAKYLPSHLARNFEAARDLALLWERTGQPIRPAESAPVPVTEEQDTPGGITIEQGIAAYIADATERGNAGSTLEKKGNIFTTGPQSLRKFALNKGLRFLSELTIVLVREWRGTWPVEGLTRYKRQGQVIGFFWFCERSGWFPPHYATNVTKGLGRIEYQPTQTDYFTPEEYKKVLDSTWLYSDRPSIDKHDALTVGGERIRALTELMRWTGLRIRCAVTLEKSKLTVDPANGMWSVIVYQRKTGEPVYCPIPPDVADMLRTVPPSQKGNTNATYFFWTGSGTMKTIVTNWERSYAKLFKLAALTQRDGTPKRAYPHMLRDTFAVESLLSGMSIHQVSTILGHSSIKVTEKSYMPWVRARQNSLNDAVFNSWVQQGKVKAPEGIPTRRVPVLISKAG
jgi:integrase/recombinase XerD